ncbi:MAG: hypothetical protein KA214_05940 [Neisseriaceae bacterium]|nr:hypothetical protein [Neisseriaceae bacterium]
MVYLVFDLARAVGGNSPSASLSAVILAQAGIQPAVGWALMAVRIKLKAYQQCFGYFAMD